MLLTTSLTPRLRHLASEAANSPRTESQQDEKKLTTEWSKHEIELGEGEGEGESEESEDEEESLTNLVARA